ncbi:tRNA 2-thiouridine(34) synthase MnmA [Candidatus Dojkabacteria bacterium]|nr:tRNA 2-thiouridine(34) synthase MnmA [Candidatus Dojkabacteria bacterium]
MSGGVDSSVSAAILKSEGYDVTGVYMKNWSGDDFGIQGDCPWEKDQEDVLEVCKKIDIPFRSFNFEKEYREKVVEYFFAEYKAGRTPNPDVMCNKEIKFHLFLKKSLEEGADLIATGHYVQRQEANGKFKLLRGVDKNKDQSYFLYSITQEQLSKSLFPIGHLKKSEVRELADKFNLPVANKPDSQGICFIGEIDVQEFLRSRIQPHQGDIIDVDTGKKVGEHDGVEFFTLGQREGIGVGGAKEPYFVVDKDWEKNVLYVGMGSDHPKLYKDLVEIENLYLIDPKSAVNDLHEFHLTASVRYRHTPEPCKLINTGGPITIKFNDPQRAVTPGQSIVLYNGEECLGGGIIN